MNFKEFEQKLQELYLTQNHTQVFSSIYKNNKWEHGSGVGSLLEHTHGYIQFLKGFFKERNIRSVVDIGCGDWQFSKEIYPETDIDYLGIDCVSSVIEEDIRQFQSDKIKFMCADVCTKFNELPNADLYIVKDVFMHWRNKEVLYFLGRWKKEKKSKYLLSVHSTDKYDQRGWGLDRMERRNDLPGAMYGRRYLPSGHEVYKGIRKEKLFEYHCPLDKKEVFLCYLD